MFRLVTMCFGYETSCPEAYGYNTSCNAEEDIHFRAVQLA